MVPKISGREVLRRYTSKCFCILTKAKAAKYFEGYQTGVACDGGLRIEITIHELRDCFERHWNDEDFVTLKIDSRMLSILSHARHYSKNATHTSQSYYHGHLGATVNTQCSFTPWALYPPRHVCSKGDPLGPLFFCLVLAAQVGSHHSLRRRGSQLLYHKWYMDDGVVAGTRDAMARVIAIIKEQGPHLGLFIKDPNCELFSKCNLNFFPVQMKRSNTPSLVLLGAPIGDLIFCAKLIANLRSKIRCLLSRLQQIGPKDPQVAYLFQINSSLPGG